MAEDADLKPSDDPSTSPSSDGFVVSEEVGTVIVGSVTSSNCLIGTISIGEAVEVSAVALGAGKLALDRARLKLDAQRLELDREKFEAECVQAAGQVTTAQSRAAPHTNHLPTREQEPRK
jgi:hypothetical protein